MDWSWMFVKLDQSLTAAFIKWEKMMREKFPAKDKEKTQRVTCHCGSNKYYVAINADRSMVYQRCSGCGHDETFSIGVWMESCFPEYQPAIEEFRKLFKDEGGDK